MKKIATLFLLSISFSSYAQPTDMNQADNGKFAPYMGTPFVLFVDKADTLFCEKVELWMKGQEVQEVGYTANGNKTILKGKDVMQLQAFYAEGQVLMELMPLDPEKPDKKKQHLFKNLVGYFTVWTNNHRILQGLQQFNWGNTHMVFPTTIEMMSINSGEVIKVTKKLLHEVVYPKFNECKGVQKTEMQGFLELNYMELTDKCFDYNRLCASE